MKSTTILKITLCYLILCPLLSLAQEKPYREPTGLNNWYLEIVGAGYLYSFNYEKILFRSGNLGWVGRVGLGYTPTNVKLFNSITLDKNTFMTPFTTSILFGSAERKEKIEIGGGFTMFSEGITQRTIGYTGVLGFRVIETNKVVFRATYTPTIASDGKFYNWFGVSLGRNFSLK